MSGREEDIRTPPPLSQDTPPQPWTPPAQFGSEAASRPGLTVDVNPASSGPIASGQGRPPWASGRYGRRRGFGSPILGPILLIAAGVVFLLNNMGVLPWSIWGQLWRLWPLLLVAIGLDMLIGRRSSFMSLVIIVLVLGAGAGFLYYSGGFDPGNIVQEQVNIAMSGPLGASTPVWSANDANITVKPGMGDLEIDSQAGGQLATGTLEYYDKHKPPDQSVNVRGGLVEVNLEEHDDTSFQWFGFNSRSPRWSVHLTTQIPINLKVDTGTGNSTLDLRNVKLDNLEVNTGTGDATVQLPSPTGTVGINMGGGTGDFDITLPEGVEGLIRADTGTGDVSIPSRFMKKSDGLYISSGYETATNRLDMTVNLGTGDVHVK